MDVSHLTGFAAHVPENLDAIDAQYYATPVHLFYVEYGIAL